MTLTLQVLYPVSDDTRFDYEYYFDTHMALVGKHIGSHIAGATASRGISGPPGQPAPFYAIATISFADQAALDAAMAVMGPVLEDIPKFTNSAPQMMIGEVA